MKKRGIILTGAMCCSAGMVAAQERPNVLFILADDYGWKDMSCSGSEYYETPNLDRLAFDGVRFTQAYATCQVSSPTRASIMTGKYTPRHGITDWIGSPSGEEWRKNNRFTKLLPAPYRHHLPFEDTTVAEAMREGGYKTFFAGKWHLGEKGSYPTDHGFDINVGGWESGGPSGGYFSPFNNPQLPNIVPGEELSMRLARETVSFIEQHESQAPQQPFFAYLSFYAVHGAIETDREKWSYFRDKATRGEVPEDGFMRDRTLPVRQYQDNPVYAGLVRQMDDAVGIVLRALEEMGLMENTLIVFTSDNGGVSSGDAYATSNLPLRGGKGRQWEGGIREPLIVKMPQGESAGEVCDTPVISTDFYPTILDVAGLPLRPAQHVDGVSLKPLLHGGDIAPRPLFWHYPHYGNQGGEPSSIIRYGDWKLIFYHEDGRSELYDLASDPYETTDVSPSNKKLVKELKLRLDEWLVETGARMPTLDPKYDPAVTERKEDERFENNLRRQEQLRKEMLRPDWQPNETWWDSKTI